MTDEQPEDADRVLIWQAQGILMELRGCEADEADVWLRWRARADKRSAVEAAIQLVTRNRTGDRAPRPDLPDAPGFNTASGTGAHGAHLNAGSSDGDEEGHCEGLRPLRQSKVYPNWCT